MHVGRRIWLLMAVARRPGRLPDRRHGLALAACRDAVPARRRSTSTSSSPSTTATPSGSRASRPSRRSTCRWTNRTARSRDVDGRLALERPRNFKLELEPSGRRQGRHRLERRGILVLGGQAREGPKSIYWCNYARPASRADLPVTYQPDWIIEAMGLKPITPEEAARSRSAAGPTPGHDPADLPGHPRSAASPTSREMVVSNSDRRIKKLRIFAETPQDPDRRGAVRATTRRIPPATARLGDRRDRATCPQKLKLRLEARAARRSTSRSSDVKVNQFDHAHGRGHLRRAEHAGLHAAEPGRAEPGRPARSADPDPADDAAARVRGTTSDLGRPAPISDDDADRPRRSADRSTGSAARRAMTPPLPDARRPRRRPDPAAARTPAAVAVVVTRRRTGAGLDDRASDVRGIEPKGRAAIRAEIDGLPGPLESCGSTGAPLLGGLAEPLAGLGQDRADRVLGDAELLADLAVVQVLEVIEPDDLGLARGRSSSIRSTSSAEAIASASSGVPSSTNGAVGVGVAELGLAMALDQLLDADPPGDRPSGRSAASWSP